MTYKGKACEIIGMRETFGKDVAWIRLLEEGTFHEVLLEDLKSAIIHYSLPYIRYVSIAAKIRDEVARKNILAPYESSLIPLPHQILVLEKVMQSPQNRFLLADEVGMGKTIETGLILKELKLRDEIKRVLAIVPKSSMLQWQSEMKEHFNEVFHVYDSEMITSMARTFSNLNADEEFNFWKQHNQIIVSTDALKPLEKRKGWSSEKINEYNHYRMEAVLDADFDIVIIDEAHKMGGSTATVSRYQLSQELCNTVPNVLLLTATPHRGKSDHFRRVLQLLDPDAFTGDDLPSIRELEPYVMRTEKRHAIDYEGNKLFNERKTIRFEVELDEYLHAKQIALYNDVTDYVRRGFRTAERKGNSVIALIMILFQRIVSSSTAAIISAMRGRLHRLETGQEQTPDDLADEYDNDFDLIDDYIGLGSSDDGVYLSIEKENEIKMLSSLIKQAEDCARSEIDAKAQALADKIRELIIEKPAEDFKALVFTEFRTTQQMLVEFFNDRGYKTAFIHGGMNLDQRKTALAQFRYQAQIMISTDAAGESLNMQYCNVVFNYDLPWNPLVIEQRIGRVDRIGQKDQVLAYNMFTNNSVDLRVYEVIEEKLNLILQQLGIDKTSDVLDSTIDMKQVNALYLQSLLNPDKFDFKSDSWLYDIKNKLREYKSTEGVLPMISKSEIKYKKAADVKYSPLPYWLESLVQHYTVMKNGVYEKSLFGYINLSVDGEQRKIVFDAENALKHPDAEHITLQHDLTRKMLANIVSFDTEGYIPVFYSVDGRETKGYWSLWQISAHSKLGNKTEVHAFFVTDERKQFTGYANDIWSSLINNDNRFELVDQLFLYDRTQIKHVSERELEIAYDKIEAKLKKDILQKKENKIKAFEYQQSRNEKIGIENVRNYRIKALEKEHQKWIEEFEADSKIVPQLKLLLMLRIDG